MTPHLLPAGNVRVLHVIAPGPVGGAESVVLGLTAGLAAVGVDVVLAVLADARSGPVHPAAREQRGGRWRSSTRPAGTILATGQAFGASSGNRTPPLFRIPMDTGPR